MKKLFALLMLVCVLAFSLGTPSIAQEDTTAMDVDTTGVEAEDTTATTAFEEEEEPAAADLESEPVQADQTFHQMVKEKFIEGSPAWMAPVLMCLIIGLAIAIERVITLNLATTNNKKLLAKVEDAYTSGGADAALEVTRNTKGPVASIFTQGLLRYPEGIDMVEKSIVAYGSVEMGRLERGLVWISLFIALAPMLGFMGTVVGMIEAFDAIEAAGDISPALVAGGIKVALLTTVAGLIVAVILQVFYNYLVSKIDSLVNKMEDASISLVDMLVHHDLAKKRI